MFHYLSLSFPFSLYLFLLMSSWKLCSAFLFQLLYTGEFDKQLSGLYLSQYTDGTGKRK